MRRFSIGSSGMANDVALAPNGDAYITDSARGYVFRIPARAQHRSRSAMTRLRPAARLAESPTGTSTNGIVSAGRRYLLVAGTVPGALVRVDLETGRVRPVKVSGSTLAVLDGIAREGRTLYVANAGSRVTELELSRNWLRARARRDIIHPSFRLPTTGAIADRRLLVVNSQFNLRGGTPVLPFTVTDLPRS